MINPRPAPLVLTDGERARLAAWADDPSAGPLALRARIVLACAAGPPGLTARRPVARVAAELGLSRDTVRKWRSRFAQTAIRRSGSIAWRYCSSTCWAGVTGMYSGRVR